MSDLGQRVRNWTQRDRDDFRAESQDLGWTAWFFAQGVLWVIGLALMAALAAVGRPMWGLISALVSVTGGLGLARAYHRHQGRRSDNL